MFIVVLGFIMGGGGAIRTLLLALRETVIALSFLPQIKRSSAFDAYSSEPCFCRLASGSCPPEFVF